MTKRRTAVVTGASGGIGKAIAGRLAREGHRVVLVGRRAAPLEAVAAEIGQDATSLPLDLTIASSGWMLSAAAPEVDVLVHSAAAYAPYGRLEKIRDDDWQAVFDAGPTAAMRISRAVLPGMKARGFGRLVFIGSLAATTGSHGQAAYSAAKSALFGLARSIALEGGRYGVTANVVEPGLIDTPRVRSVVTKEALASLVAATPAGRPGTPEEVAAAVAFLCSGDAAFVTGAVLPVTGGLGLGLAPSPNK